MMISLVVAVLVVVATCPQTSAASQFKLEKSIDIATVPAGFPVGFCLWTDGQHQYVAYYDHQRRMTIGMRTVDSETWQFQVLPTKVGWDSHNYITMAVDRDGHLHVSGNMHAVKLIYFRTEKPRDITTLKRFSMTGKLENRATYPRFMTDHNGTLVFTYRHGGAGNGINIYNKYDTHSRRWSRLTDAPLFDGEGKMNAYPSLPVLGPDGMFHTFWVWRDTPDCATNHHLSYARSKDLVHWESAFGQMVTLPIKQGNKALWVDAIPSGGGIINGGAKLIFDINKQPVISYHKSDANGDMQIYVTRPEAGQWRRHVLTDWAKPIKFSGRGSMGFIGIRISGFKRLKPGVLSMRYRHRDYGSGHLVFDEKTLKPLNQKIDHVPEYPAALNQVQSDFPGMVIRRTNDIGRTAAGGVRSILQWETLGRNHDRPRQPPLPAPSMLRLHWFTASDADAQ
ncbi:MAG: BNR repeat-containing protein [Verrucomicrobiae bacterium]|nr:BNR repeat-containing protein [Verrucomicrobiae bacterium]NNJ43782.1 hypothetical protein [Akkermansiaceae bacterium]